MRLLTVLMLCCALILGGLLRAGGEVAQALVQASVPLPQQSTAEPCGDHHHAAASNDARRTGKASPASCHTAGGGHVCCLPPLTVALPVLPASHAAPGIRHAHVPGLLLAERIDVPYRPPAA